MNTTHNHTRPNKSQNSAAMEDLACLYEITKKLASTKSSSTALKKSLEKVVRLLAEIKGMDNGTVTIINPKSRKLEIEVAHGISSTGRKKGKYALGEGITGQVAITGKAVIVPQISEEPDFLNRTGSRSNVLKNRNSFLCVPIKIDSTTIGTVSIDQLYNEKEESLPEQDLCFLTVVSGLIAQTVQRVQQAGREKEVLRRENQQLRRKLADGNRVEGILGNSSRMREVFEMVQRVADSNATVLLRGESGTGKTLVARALHHNSARSTGPFIVVNCSALPESLLESELFGHEKGAFTGAHERKIGRFEQAEGGTLFLDEIGEISTSVQIKLLNVIQERTYQRLGGTSMLAADIRLVAATNRDLEKAVKNQGFREDLYYRLNVFPVFMPPLRERRTDILLLADHFLIKYSKENDKQIQRISSAAIDMLIQYHWPGNVRELENCMERAVIICDESVIKGFHLPPTLQRSETNTIEYSNMTGTTSLTGAVASFEREMITEALKATNGNQTKAAKYLDTSLRIINYKIHNYGIEPKQFKINRNASDN